MPPTVLAVATNAVLAACERLGLERDMLLDTAALDAEALRDPDARIPATAADAVWAAALAHVDDPYLAIHVAEALPFGAYRVVDFLAAHAPSLADALERCAAYFPLIDPRARLDWQRDGHGDGDGSLSFRLVDGRPMPRRAVEYTFTAFISRTRAAGIDWTPANIELVGVSEGPEHDAELHRAWGQAPSYGASLDRLIVAAADCEQRPRTSNPALFEVLDHHASLLLDALPPAEIGLVTELRTAIEAELRGGQLTLDRVARRLGLSGRTLQRRLDAEALRFGELVDEVKAELAKAYLDDRALALVEVAFMLGFADQSAFTRAFKRWTGLTPGRYRKRQPGA